MPVIEPEAKLRKKVLSLARGDPSVVEILRANCEFLNSSSQHHVVEQLLCDASAATRKPRLGLNRPPLGKQERAFLNGGLVMLRILLEHRGLVSAVIAGVWSFGHLRVPFPATNDARARPRECPPRSRRHSRRVQPSVVHQLVPRQLLRAAVRLHFVLRPCAGIERISPPRYPEPADRSALSLVIYPFAEQLLAYRLTDPNRRRRPRS